MIKHRLIKNHKLLLILIVTPVDRTSTLPLERRSYDSDHLDKSFVLDTVETLSKRIGGLVDCRAVFEKNFLRGDTVANVIVLHVDVFIALFNGRISGGVDRTGVVYPD